jgi:hypothetical protein
MRRETSITDFFLEALMPVLIIGLIWSLVVFAITIKGVFYPGQASVLSKVFFCYVMGTVMVNRIAGLYGESGKAFFYGILLTCVMGLFAVTFSARYGSILGGTYAGSGLFANLAIIAMIGAASHLICRESFRDIKKIVKTQKGPIQQKGEIRKQLDWYQREVYLEEQKEKLEAEARAKPEELTPQAPERFSEKHPATAIISFSLFSMIVFAAGQRFLPRDNWELYMRGYNCLLANLVCALALLMLITLSELRLRCHEKKAAVPDGVGWFWVASGGFLILLVVSLASLLPRPVPEYLVQSRTVAVAPAFPDEADEKSEKSSASNSWAGLNRQLNIEAEKELQEARELEEQMEAASRENKEDEEGGGSDRPDGEDEPPSEAQGDSGEPSQGQYASRKDRPGKNSEPSKSPDRINYGGRARSAPRPTAPLKGLEAIGKVALVLTAAACVLWACVKLIVSLGRANPFKKLLRFGSLREKLRGLFRNRRQTGRSKKQRQTFLREHDLHMENPFNDEMLLRQMSKTELVSYTYKAFENYAYVQGHSPREGQTAVEFTGSLPEEFQTAEFSALVRMFMLAEYSPHEISDKNLKNLKKIWTMIET